MSAVVTPAPAKINWTLEVLALRPDGYHEVRTVLQTIDLADRLRLSPSDGIHLTLSGRCDALAGLPLERNLAYRAALLLRERTGHKGGARIEVEKRIPVGAGLGGGSTDAAAALRGLSALWRLDLAPAEMASLAAELGSDVPFFLAGGAALAEGRGEAVTPLPDVPDLSLLLAIPPGEAPAEKTARMYARLRAEHFTDRSATSRLVERLKAGGVPRPEDLVNVFDAVAADALPGIREAIEAGRTAGAALQLAGAGRGLFCLSAGLASPAARALAASGCQLIEVSTLPSAAATAVAWES